MLYFCPGGRLGIGPLNLALENEIGQGPVLYASNVGADERGVSFQCSGEV